MKSYVSEVEKKEVGKYAEPTEIQEEEQDPENPEETPDSEQSPTGESPLVQKANAWQKDLVIRTDFKTLKNDFTVKNSQS